MKFHEFKFRIDENDSYEFHFMVNDKGENCIGIRRIRNYNGSNIISSFIVSIINNTLFWREYNEYWIAQEAKNYIEKVFKNKAFL